MKSHLSKGAALSAVSLLSAGLLLSGTAQASSYTIVSGTLSDIRMIGARAVPNITDYAGHGGSLDATDPANWELAIPGFGSWDWQDPTTPPTAGSGMLALIGGAVSVTGGSVYGATLGMLPGQELTFGTFQSCARNDGQAGTTADPALIDIPCTISDVITRNLVWSYDPNTGQLLHAGDNGIYGNDSAFQGQNGSTQNWDRLSVCDVAGGNTDYGGASGEGFSGSCRSFRALINNASLLSIWNWQGIQADYAVQDNANLPWNFGNATGDTLVVAGPGGHTAVTWDMSGFTPGVGGTIIAHVTSMGISLTNQDRTAVSATYTLQVVPVPAAVWLFASGLGLIGWLRRRARLSA